MWGRDNMTATITGGTQTTNNVSGTGGLDVTGYTDQTAVASQYITATGLTATVNKAKATYSVTGQRGAGINYNSTTNLIEGGSVWDYKGDGTTVTNYGKEHIFDVAGTYTTALTLNNPLNTTGVSVSGSVTVTGTNLAVTTKPYVYQDGNNNDTITASVLFAGGSTYQWYYSADWGTSWNAIGTATSQTCTLPSTFKNQLTYHFKCIATDSAGNTLDTFNDGNKWVMLVVSPAPAPTSSGVSNHDQSFISNQQMNNLDNHAQGFIGRM